MKARLRAWLAQRQPVKRQTLSSTNVDSWFNRAGQASQVLLLLLGVFGYFYTVVPVYQKALLDEDIAQKTLQLRDVERKVAELRDVERKVAELEQQISDRALILKQKDSALADLTQKADQAQKRQAAAEEDAALAGIQAIRNYRELRRRLTLQSLASFDWCSTSAMLGKLPIDLGKVFHGIEPESFRTCVESNISQSKSVLSGLDQRDVTLYETLMRAAQARYQPAFDISQKNNRSSIEASLVSEEDAEKVFLTEVDAARSRGDRSLETFEKSYEVKTKARKKTTALIQAGSADLRKFLQLIASDVAAGMNQDE